MAAAAGLIIGVFCTSAIWAATETGRQKILTLFHDSFESGPAPVPTGAPTGPDAWGGDFAEISEAISGVEPLDGARMFRFLRADYLGKENSGGYRGDIYRVIDLRESAPQFADGGGIAAVEVAFGSAAFDESKRLFAGLSLKALDQVPADAEAWRAMIGTRGRLDEVVLASALRREVLSPSSGDPWQRVNLEMRLPGETRFLLIGLHMGDLKAAGKRGEEPAAVHFDGQFADDVRVTLRRAQ